MTDFITVYVAELTRRIKSRPFIIGLIIGAIGIFAFIQMPNVIGGAFGGDKQAIIVGEPTLTAPAVTLLKGDLEIAAVLAPQPVDASLLQAHHASSAIVLSRAGDRLHVAIFAKDPGSVPRSQVRSDLLPLQVQLAMHGSRAAVNSLLDIPVTIHPIDSKFSSSSQALAVRGIAYTLIFFLYMLIMLNSQLVMSAVAEEKTSRIAELLVASVDPVALLGGKIIAAATLALLQMAIWVGVGIFASLGQAGSPDASPIALDGLFSGNLLSAWVLCAFVLFFICGFLQLSTLFASVASLVNRTEDLGSLSAPLVLPVIAAFFIAVAALGEPDAPWVVATSFVPILSPFVMFARIAVSNVALWQVAVSLALNILALIGIAILGGKLYRVGMLLYGRAPKFSQIWSVIRS
ncbi:MAG: ABC transporter permease [Vulcanimicrobiaceae bacterium]